MGAQVRCRRQASLNVNAFSNKIVNDLGRGMIYREIALRFYGSFTYAAAGNNIATTLGRGDEWSALARIDIVVNGTDTIRSYSGAQLVFFNRLVYGGIPALAQQMADGVTASPVFDSTCIIPFWMPLAVKPMDTALDSSKLSNMRIEVTVDAATSVNSANGPTAIAATLDVVSIECFNVEGLFSDCRIYSLQSVQGGANPNVQIQLPVTALYRGFIINAADGAGNNATDLPNAITNVQLVSGTTIFRDIPFKVLTDWQRQRLGWNREAAVSAGNSVATANSGGMYMRMRRSSLPSEQAWAFLDLIQDGYLAEGTDAAGFSELYLNIAVSAACTLTILPIQVFPVRAKG